MHVVITAAGADVYDGGLGPDEIFVELLDPVVIDLTAGQR
jgi:hypothetical protein